MPEGIEPFSTISSPRAASQRASAPTVARSAQEPAPKATASKVSLELCGRRSTQPASAGDQACCRALRDALKEPGLPLADAHAEGRQAVTAVAASELVEERDHETGAAHPERMAERDRAAVHVHLLLVQAELADDDETLRRERLVQLHEIDLVDPEARPLQQLPDRRARPDAHHARVDPCDGAADEAAQRLDAEFLRLLLAGDHERGCSVVDAAGVARGHGPTLSKRRLQRSKLPGVGVGARMFVTFDASDRNELLVEASRLGRCPPSFL